MIRLGLAFVVPTAMALAAAWLVGPEAVSGPRGEPIMVASGERMAALQTVDHAGCAPKLLTGAAPEPGNAEPASIRVVKLSDAPDGVSVTELPFDAPAGTHVVLVLDPAGRLVAAGERPAAEVAASRPECPVPPAVKPEPGII